MDMGMIMAVAGAAIAVTFSGVGSSIGIGHSAQAANGAMSVDPKNFVNFLILSVLPGTQGIYGFVAAFFVINKIGLLGTPVALTTAQGWQIFMACIPIAIGGWFSGIHQGKVSAAGISVAVKQEKDFMKAVIMSALVETYAVLALLITIMLLLFIKVG